MRARPERQFYFRLAGHLGYTVGELLRRISSREITEWMVYERITGPLGGRRSDVQMSVLASVVANSQRTKGRALTPKDFLPAWDGRQRMTPEEMFAAVSQVNTAFGGTVRRARTE